MVIRENQKAIGLAALVRERGRKCKERRWERMEK